MLLAAACSRPTTTSSTAAHGSASQPKEQAAPALVARARTSGETATAPASDDSAPGAAPAARAETGAGQTWLLALKTGASPEHPEVLAHLPPHYDASRPLALVLFLHGWYGCVSVVAAATDAPCHAGGPVRYAIDVVSRFDAARVNALLVIPQLAFEAPSSAPGRLGAPGGLRAALAELLATPELTTALGRRATPEGVGRTLIFAHSGAFVPAAAMLAGGDLPVDELHMLDALYRTPPAITHWVTATPGALLAGADRPRRFTVLYTDKENTGPRSRAYVEHLIATLPAGVRAAARVSEDDAPPDDIDFAHPIVLRRTLVAHEHVPQTFLAPLLRTAGLDRIGD